MIFQPLSGSRRCAAIVALGLLASACTASTSPSEPPSGPPSTTSGSSTPDLAAVQVRLLQVASLDQPVAMAMRPGDPVLYVAEKTGKVVAVLDGSVDPDPVLDISPDVTQGSEQGLLGLVFSPDGRFMYVNFTDVNGDTHVTEFGVKGGRAQVSSRRDVLVVDQPFANHNGGDLAFGPDGYLYVGLGDGGSEGDPQGNGQSLSTLLGKMLRVSPRPSSSGAYGIPSDNPFVAVPGARPEIWAYGLRNPWRYSFDRVSGDLWIGDVGQNTWEEIDVHARGAPPGENFGWNAMEGLHAFEGSPPDPNVLPVFEYPHDDGGCAVTGGYVYRGDAIPNLVGSYVFGDFCVGQLVALQVHDRRVTGRRDLGLRVSQLSSLGEDAAGELYVMSLEGGLYELVPSA